ncbi:Rpn family recombination-promoting nuclease/putative transposase [Duganella sp. S19_KUP01_CR8]|uniref:Rpn family recombination-promoting nuclease/putative transposase n=1 Tax=Duganella sp. S19_KUP01_CR8 TaxID=3025502 RepID=UPI002FCDB127
MASEDDTASKQLFAYPEMVRDLLLGFVPGDWVRQLELTSLERVNGSYVSDGGVQRHSDMVWRVRLAGEWIYIYLLLEFQSRSDPWMALRMQVCVGLLYQDLIKRHELPQPGRLPPVFPVVLYNGMKPWSACRDLAELVLPTHSDLAYLQPSQRYLLIDQHRLDKCLLEYGANFLATVFRVESLVTTEALVEESKHWNLLSESDVGSDFKQSFNRWIACRLWKMTRRRKLDLQGLIVKERIVNVPHFDTIFDALRYETQLVGQRTQLQRLLMRRFGSVSKRLQKRIENGEIDDLDRWFDRFYDAKNIKEIFAEDQPA